MHKQKLHVNGGRIVIRILCAAFISALAMGNVDAISAAQAAPAGATPLRFTMHALKEREVPACRGELVHISVVVIRDAGVQDFGDELMDLGSAIPGVEVKGLVQNPNIGELSPNSNTTIVAGMMRPNSADFIFTANNYGETTISFRGMVATPGWFGSDWGGGAQAVSDFVHVRVIPCKYEVKAVSIFRAGMTSVGTMDGQIEADEQGNFTGSATVNWVTSMICGIASPIAPGSADLTGTINESGQLVGEIIFGPITSVGGGTCGLSTLTTSNFGTLDPLTIEASSEGASVYTQAQAIHMTNGSFTGSATIVVSPVEDEAVALVPGAHQAKWNDLSSFFGSLLTLLY